MSINNCRLRLRIGGHSMIFPPEQKYSNEQKVEIIFHSSIENFQPGLLMNSEQKAGEMRVRPAIAKSTVSCI
jgi:hypothetical protein